MADCFACRNGLCAACSGYAELPIQRTCACYNEHADRDPHRHPQTAAAANARAVEECKARREHHLDDIGGMKRCAACRTVVTPQDLVTEWTTQ